MADADDVVTRRRLSTAPLTAARRSSLPGSAKRASTLSG